MPPLTDNPKMPSPELMLMALGEPSNAIGLPAVAFMSDHRKLLLFGARCLKNETILPHGEWEAHVGTLLWIPSARFRLRGGDGSIEDLLTGGDWWTRFAKPLDDESEKVRSNMEKLINAPTD